MGVGRRVRAEVSLRTLISRIHTYAGLLTFANVILYAIVGIAALFDTRSTPAADVTRTEVPFGFLR